MENSKKDFDIDYEQKPNEYEDFLVTTIQVEDTEYYLFSNGNLYEKKKNGEYEPIDNLSTESKKLIKKIMDKLKPGKTDIIYEDENEEELKQENDSALEI